MRILACIIVGGFLGFISAVSGYGIDTWQYWVFTIPAAGVCGAVVYKTLS